MNPMTDEYRKALHARFFAKVAVSADSPSGCWLWTGAKSFGGYGTIRLRLNGIPKNRIASRVSWMLKHGEFPTENVLHRCDTPACVNPAHLFLGTMADNVADMKSKGRQRHWGRIPGGPRRVSKRKVTDRDIVLIRDAVRCGARYREIASAFGVRHEQIRRIALRESWSHIP